MRAFFLLILMMSFIACAATKSECRGVIESESYYFSYDDPLLEMKKSEGPDFYLYRIKRMGSDRILVAMYLGGAPDVHALYENKKSISTRDVAGLKMEELERRSGDDYSYEALIALPPDSIGRLEYFHIMSKDLKIEDLHLVKKIILSIRSK